MKTGATLSSGIILVSWLSAVCSSEAQTVRVCVGQYETRCGPHDLFLECGSNVEAKAQEICKTRGSSGPANFNIVKGADIPGNRCGYASFLVICK